MKRAGNSSAEARKKPRAAVSGHTARYQQPGQREVQAAPVTLNSINMAEKLVSEAKQARNQFETSQWACGNVIDKSLADHYKKMLEEALQPIGDDKCWRLNGNSLLSKDEVMIHYPQASGVFQQGVTSLEGFHKAEESAARKPENKRDAQLAVFNFGSATMYDEDTGEMFKVSLGDCVEVTEEIFLKNPAKEINIGGRKVVKIGKHVLHSSNCTIDIEGHKFVVEDDKVVEIDGRKVVHGEDPEQVVVEHDHLMRVTEIFYSAKGEYMFKGHWFYEDIDTAIAAKPRDQKYSNGIPELPSGDHLGHPRQLWLCGSDSDNETYTNTYHIGVINKKVKIHQIAPGLTSPPPNLEFDADDYFYNSFTVRPFITIEDLWEDWMPWSLRYNEVLRREGLEGIQKLRDSCGGNFTKLMRGPSHKELGHPEHRVLPVLELFAGGGGISHITRSNGRVEIRHGWANDINQSACATYNCNAPEAHVFCQGLEELLQLFIKWNSEVERYLGKEWRTKLEGILQGGPQHKYSRRHVPKGVACWGTTVGKEGTSADVFLEAAIRGDEAVKASGLEESGLEADDPEAHEPDWDAIISTLQEVRPTADDALPSPPVVEGSDMEKKAIEKAYEKAIEVQKQRIAECRQRVEELELGKVVEVRDVRITDCAVRVKHGSSRNQLDEGLTDYECWLEFEVRREGSTEWEWEHQFLLWRKDAVLPMRHFMLRMLADRTIPMPGDVGLLTGGPPCQNVSGLNRQAPQKQILNDPKNRLVTSYVRITEFLKPKYLLMEQVCDVFKKAGGLYARYALQQMVQMGYQCRAGICTAGNYGSPQGRRRALFWGALSGQEQLPAFPAPTHVCKDFNQPFPSQAAGCAVEIPDSDRKYEMVVLGDVLTDLPEISNFEESDRAEYSRPPQYITQEFLRRFPTKGGRSLAARCIYADAAMAPWQNLYQKLQDVTDGLLAEEDGKILGLGNSVLCKNKGTNKTSQKKKESSKKGMPAATPAASAAEKADGSDDDDEAQQDAADLVDEDDLDGNAGEEAKELATAINEQKNFARQTWLSHLHHLTKDAEEREVLSLMQDSEELSTIWMLGKHRLTLLAAKMAANARLRDHRTLLCNADDFGRMCAVPRLKGANFRNMPGAVTHTDNTNCVGSWHAGTKCMPGQQEEVNKQISKWNKLSPTEAANMDPIKFVYKNISMQSACPAGGMPPKPPKGLNLRSGNDKSMRVDHYGSTAQGAWRGTSKDGCPSQAFWMSTGDLVCPRWCCTYKQGQCNGRHGCFGRVWYDDIQPTVVTRAEPHNLQLIHPAQDRVLSIRENARCQGFPDFHVFVGLGKGRGGSHGKGAATVDERYMQIGNAVSPLLSANLGECLLLAAAEESPIGEGIINVELQEYEQAVADGRRKGLGFWCKHPDNKVDDSKGNDYYWRLHNPEGCRKTARSKAATAAAAGAHTDKEQAANDSEAAAGSKEAAAAAGSRPSSSKAAAAHSGLGSSKAAAAGSGPSSGQQAAAPSGPANGKAAARAGTSSAGIRSNQAQGKERASAGTAPAPEPLCGASSDAAAAGSGAAKVGQQKRKHRDAAAEGAAVERTADAAAAVAPKRSRSSASDAAGGTSGTSAGGSGRSRPQRASAVAAQQATRDQLELESASVQKHRTKLQELQRRSTPQKTAAADQAARDAAAERAAAAEQPRRLQLAAEELEPEEPAVMGAAAAGAASDESSDDDQMVLDANSNRSSADVVLPDADPEDGLVGALVVAL